MQTKTGRGMATQAIRLGIMVVVVVVAAASSSVYMNVLIQKGGVCNTLLALALPAVFVILGLRAFVCRRKSRKDEDGESRK
jgi:hypothetical protein